MGKRISFDILDKKSIDKAIHELVEYSRSLNYKCQQFCDELMNIGYTIAMSRIEVSGRYGTHLMGNYVWFTISTQPFEGGCQSYLLGFEKEFISTWKSNGQQFSAIVYPLEMLEFGTGRLALSPTVALERFNVISGQGTMDIAGNSGKADWGKNNNWSAITPTMPMYSAYLEMLRDIDNVARKVFRG